MREEVIAKILEEKVIAIVRGYSAEEVTNLAKALYRGGLSFLEITFPQDSRAAQEETAALIRKLNAELGDKMIFGAGTVTTVELADLAYEAGCKYIVSPDTFADVIKRTRELGLVSIPGALTPTEIAQAVRAGADFIKVFPACSMGPAYFKHVHAPLPMARMLAVGSVNAENAADYLKAGAVGVGVASCLFSKELIRNGEWEKITGNAKALRKIIG